MPLDTVTKPPRHRSKRQRRIAWTAGSLAVVLAIAAIVTWRIQKDNQPDEYVPGEASSDITNVIADRGTEKPTPAVNNPARATTSRKADPLLNPGKPLPTGAPAPLFTDVTTEAGLNSFRQFQGTRTSQLPEDTGSGLAWGDFDGDGLEDVFVVSGGGPLGASESQLAPSALYRNIGNGHFEKVKGFPELRI